MRLKKSGLQKLWRVPKRFGHLNGLRRIPLRMIIPSLVTLLALCAGLTSLRMAYESRFEWAVFAILIAGILDMFDGRLARFLHATSRFGAELDSLADFVNFGVAPAFMLYVWRLSEVGSLGWLCVLLFAIASGLRLARFNSMPEACSLPHWQIDFFVGIPAPAGALIVLLPFYLERLDILPESTLLSPLIMLYITAVAFSMVSWLPTFSGKRFGRRVPRENLLFLLILVILCVGLFASYPFIMLTLFSVAYLLSLPFSWKSWKKRMK